MNASTSILREKIKLSYDLTAPRANSSLYCELWNQRASAFIIPITTNTVLYLLKSILIQSVSRLEVCYTAICARGILSLSIVIAMGIYSVHTRSTDDNVW